MSERRKLKLNASQDKFDHHRQTRYCIDYSQKHIQNQKKQSFLNKLSFDYSLQKINRQKFIGNLIPFSSLAFPTTKAQGNKYCNFQYSSQLYKATRNKFLSQRKQKKQKQQQQQTQVKRTTHLIAKRRRSIHGGIDSFWLFKRSPTNQIKHKAKAHSKHQIGEEEMQGNQNFNQNKLQKAFIKLLGFAKLPLEIQSSIVPKNAFQKYLSNTFGQYFGHWFISKNIINADFYQIKSYINFKQFETLCEKFKNISVRQSHLVSYFLYDENGDGLVCPRDFFSKFDRQISPKIDQDVFKLAKFIKLNVGRQNVVNQQFKIQNICIRDDWLTIKDYQMYFKKLDEPFLKATNKRDTVFSSSFAVLDHRQKIRSKRKQMNQKKHMFEQLYGQLSKVKKNQANIDSQSQYKLNYTLFHELFGNSTPELYNYFIHFVFGLGSIKLQQIK